MHDTYEYAACAPNIYLLDNEFSLELQTALKKAGTDYQLVTPHSHRNNLAERVIQTWKNNFKAGLATHDPHFPLTEWDKLIEQANITLCMLRSLRSNPKLSAYA